MHTHVSIGEDLEPQEPKDEDENEEEGGGENNGDYNS